MKTDSEKPDAAKGPDALFYLWYGNARMWDCAIGWLPRYPKGMAKDELRKRRLAKASRKDPSVVQSLLNHKECYEMMGDNTQ
jgi:hypothetical protein